MSSTAAELPLSDESRLFPSGDAERNFAEFFAGIGLVHAGLSPLGWRCVYANDIEPKKKGMYEHLFGRVDYYHVEDVWKTEEVVKRIPGQIQLATASFPCVDLSLAGNRRGFSGIESGTFHAFLRVLRKLKQQERLPRVLLIENVMGFLTSNNGADFKLALDELVAFEYTIDAFVVDAKYFTAQSRPRLFVVAWQPDQTPSIDSHDSEQMGCSAARPAQLLGLLRMFLGSWRPMPIPEMPPMRRDLQNYIDTDEEQDWWPTTRVKKHLDEMEHSHLSKLLKLKVLSVPTVGTIYRRVRGGRSRSEVRSDGLAGCLRTPRGGSSKQIVFLAGQQKIKMRWMTPREYARLQGCPDFPILVDQNSALFGFGDAVCVPAITWIASNVLEALLLKPSAKRARQSLTNPIRIT